MGVFSSKIESAYRNEYRDEYPEDVKKYVDPKIYSGGESSDLSKRWYVYYSYINPKTGKMERQAPIYLDVNKEKSKRGRMKRLKIIKAQIQHILDKGDSPYENTDTPQHTAESLILYAIEYKKKIVSKSSYDGYSVRGGNFIDFLKKRSYNNRSIAHVTKKHVIDFLNDKLDATTPANRNSYRRHLAALFQVLEDEDYIEKNFIKAIPVLKANPTKNKAFNQSEASRILKHLGSTDKTLQLLIYLMSYSLLRPVEACRLQVKDLDLKEKTLTVRTKTKASKIKRIPDLMMQEFEKWDLSNSEAYLITLDGVAESSFSPEHRRKSFTKRFTKVRDLLEFSSDYTLYSFRHTSITKLYRKLRESNGKLETYDKLMPITGHSTVTALEKYLRDIDAELPGDYSDLFA